MIGDRSIVYEKNVASYTNTEVMNALAMTRRSRSNVKCAKVFMEYLLQNLAFCKYVLDNHCDGRLPIYMDWQGSPDA